MRLKKHTIEEFKAICRDEFGLTLSDEEAIVHASRMLELAWSLLLDAVPRGDSDGDRKKIDTIP